MTLFLGNLLLALIWAGLTARIDLPNLILGFALGYFVLWVSREAYGPRGYFVRLPRVVNLVLFVLKEMAAASLRMAWDAATPGQGMSPAVLAIPLDGLSELEAAVLANMVTLTPGTLSLELSEDGETLFVHAMYAARPEELRRSIVNDYRRRVVEAMR